MRRFTLAVSGAMVTAVLVTTVACATATPQVKAPKVKVVATHLSSPKQLLYTANGVYVAESGTGGSDCVSGPSDTGQGTTQYCEGPTAAVALIHGEHVRVVASKLPSLLEKDSGEATGPSAVTVSKRGHLSILFQDGLVESNGSNTAPGAAATAFGTFKISAGVSAKIARFESAHPQAAATLGGTSGETTYDSDPYDVIQYRGGYVVADAAANDLLSVSKNGKIKLLARFPTRLETAAAGVVGPTATKIDAQAVPTSVAVGPDGALYVGTLRGVPSLPGTAEIYRIVPGHTPTVWTRGLTAVTAIAFDSKGRLLATELSTGGLLSNNPGALVRVSRNGNHVTTLRVSGLVEPTGVAVSPSGAVYVANYGTNAGSAAKPGEVLEITGLG